LADSRVVGFAERKGAAMGWQWACFRDRRRGVHAVRRPVPAATCVLVLASGAPAAPVDSVW